jgi:hypothetical protein
MPDWHPFLLYSGITAVLLRYAPDLYGQKQNPGWGGLA